MVHVKVCVDAERATSALKSSFRLMGGLLKSKQSTTRRRTI